MSKSNPRILIVTPEITYLPEGMGNMANAMRAKAGGLADVSASLITELFNLGADVHVSLPHYRRMFNVEIGNLISDELKIYQNKLPDGRIHLAEDRAFYYMQQVYSSYGNESFKPAMAFQREVINNIVPKVQPDLIHCNDWMTGLIPAMARRRGIPCLMTIHNIHTHFNTLNTIEDNGIDAAEFWQYLYYKTPPVNYETARNNIPVDLLTSGIFASHFINSVSPSFIHEIAEGQHAFIPDQIRSEVKSKLDSGCAVGVLNAPDETYDPMKDTHIDINFDSSNFSKIKKKLKLKLQKTLGLIQDPDAPVLFWPSRLDPVQKGPQLLAEIMYDLITKYSNQNLQVIFVANGAYEEVFKNITRQHNFFDRVAVCNFYESLSHKAYAASDFMIMPSLFEPCGLPQMISAKYGSIPIVHNTGGLHDTISPLDIQNDSGNGFLFDVHDSSGLFWAIDRAIEFYNLDPSIKNKQIKRIMEESAKKFNHSVTAKKYIKIYEKMLKRKLINTY